MRSIIEIRSPVKPTDWGESRGIAFAAAAALAFGTVSIWAKLAYRVGATPEVLLAGRFVVATVILFTYRATRKRTVSASRGLPRLFLLMAGATYAAQAAAFFRALELASAATVALLFYTYPVWTAVAASALRLESFRLRTIAAALLGFAGVAAILANGSSLAEPLAGRTLALAAAVVFSAYLLIVQRLLIDTEALALASWSALGTALSFLAVSAIIPQRLPTAALPVAAVLGVVTALAFIALYRAVVIIGASRSAVTQMLEPVTTVVLAWLVLRESLPLTVLVATLLVLASIALTLPTWTREPPQPGPR